MLSRTTAEIQLFICSNSLVVHSWGFATNVPLQQKYSVTFPWRWLEHANRNVEKTPVKCCGSPWATFSLSDSWETSCLILILPWTTFLLSDSWETSCPILVLPWTRISLRDSWDTSCAIRFFSEPVPQLRDSWDNTWCYSKPRRYRFPPCKASNLISVWFGCQQKFSVIKGEHIHLKSIIYISKVFPCFCRKFNIQYSTDNVNIKNIINEYQNTEWKLFYKIYISFNSCHDYYVYPLLLYRVRNKNITTGGKPQWHCQNFQSGRGKNILGGNCTDTKLKWTDKLCQSEIPTSLWINSLTAVHSITSFGHWTNHPLKLRLPSSQSGSFQNLYLSFAIVEINTWCYHKPKRYQ